jgi:hypothetical protein
MLEITVLSVEDEAGQPLRVHIEHLPMSSAAEAQPG